MKQRFIVFISGLIAVLSLQAQSLWDRSKPDEKFTYGLRAGLGFASTNMDYATSIRMGMHFGAIVDWNIVKSLSVESGLYYTTKGFKSDFGKGEMIYLQIPFQISYRIETPTGVQFYFNVGPYFAWGVGGTVDYKPYDATFTYDFHQKSFGGKGFFRHLDTGLSAGAYIVVGRLLWGVGYENGLYDVAKVYGKFYNRNVTTTLGFNF